MPVRLPRVTRFSPAILALILLLAWLALAPRTPDLAAAVYRALLYARHGLQLYDANWFGGFQLPGYSLIFPPLANLIGVRVTGVLAAAGSTFLLQRLLAGHFAGGWVEKASPQAANSTNPVSSPIVRERARLPATTLTLCALGPLADLVIGRLSFSLGVCFALAALLALQRGRPRVATAAGALSAASSPVTGLFLVLALTAAWLAQRDRRAALLIGATTAAIVGGLAIAFPSGGYEPCSVGTLASVVIYSGAFAYALSPDERTLRIGAALYALAGVASFLLPTPMGGNISRLGPECAPALLLAAHAAGRTRINRKWLTLMFIAFVGWQWFAPGRELSKYNDPSYQAAYYQPLIRALNADTHGPVRLEVPFTRSHWEAVYLGERFELARGWETQLDTRYDHIFFRPKLSAKAYQRWLSDNAVGYVALPDVPLDPAGKHEAALIARRPGYLRPIWHNAHWRLYRVLAATPLARAQHFTTFGPGGFSLRVTRPGTTVVRLHWTSYWSVQGRACVTPTKDGWTKVTAMSPGTIRVRSDLSLAGLLGTDRRCGLGT